VAVGVFSLVGGAATGIFQILAGWIIAEASAGRLQQARFDEALRGVSVREAMLEGPHTVPAAVSVAEAAHDYFERTGHRAYPVLRGDAVVGLLCLEDVLRLSPEERRSTSVQGAMRPLADVMVTDPDTPLLAAIARMAKARTARLLVIHEGRLLGLLTMSAVIRRLKMREQLLG
jgi:CBS domain-containing protein